jgi:hypothetical protein
VSQHSVNRAYAILERRAGRHWKRVLGESSTRQQSPQ